LLPPLPKFLPSYSPQLLHLLHPPQTPQPSIPAGVQLYSNLPPPWSASSFRPSSSLGPFIYHGLPSSSYVSSIIYLGCFHPSWHVSTTTRLIHHNMAWPQHVSSIMACHTLYILATCLFHHDMLSSHHVLTTTRLIYHNMS
jgi:hypothetical protein